MVKKSTMMNKVIIIALVGLVAALLGHTSNAQEGVRLFLTPQVRLELERRRLGIMPPAPEPEVSVIDTITELVNREPEPDVVYALGGSVIKDDGSATVWLNGVAVDEANLPEGISIQQPAAMGKLSVSANGQEYVIKPGQVLNATTGAVYEAYQWQQQLELQRLEALRNDANRAAAETISESTP